MSKQVLVPIADGSEELEAVSIIDILRRAQAQVTVAAIGGNLQIRASRGVNLVADQLIEDCVDKTYDLIVLPGGMPGAEKLRNSEILTKLLHQQKEKNQLYAAICAAPAVVLENHGLLESHKATCHPNFTHQLSNQEHAQERVVIDGNCVTSRGPGTALEFSLALVELLYGAEKSKELATSMVAAV